MLPAMEIVLAQMFVTKRSNETRGIAITYVPTREDSPYLGDIKEVLICDAVSHARKVQMKPNLARKAFLTSAVALQVPEPCPSKRLFRPMASTIDCRGWNTFQWSEQ